MSLALLLDVRHAWRKGERDTAIGTHEHRRKFACVPDAHQDIAVGTEADRRSIHSPFVFVNREHMYRSIDGSHALIKLNGSGYGPANGNGPGNGNG